MKMTKSKAASGAKIGMMAGIVLLLLAPNALAGDPQWRPTYDLAMRWINFLILAGVIVKYAREPIKNFLKLRKEEVVSRIDELEFEKTRILEEIKAVQKQGKANQVRLQEMKQRLLAQGETRKQQIIEQAKQQSASMLEETRRKMENRIVQAKVALKMELLDLAIEKATQQLPGMITDGDNQRLLDDYMNSLQT
jgi:F-type H+-transporting ATPase subunit b